MEYLNHGTATKKCLDTPEILEMILARMDMRTLLTSAQRVSRSWFNLISTSPSIQKALFFTPIKDSEWGTEEKILNPLLTETFPSIFPAKARRYGYWFNICDLPMTKDASSMARFVRKDASWRKMLVQQPPISGIGLFPISSSMGGDGVKCSSIPADQRMQESGHDELRMERLFEVLLLTRFTSPKVYWSTEEPIVFDNSSQKIKDAFFLNLSKFGLVLCTKTVIQCSVGLPGPKRPPSAAQIIREETLTAYRDHGLDVDLKRKAIQESEVEGELVSVSRYGSRGHSNVPHTVPPRPPPPPPRR
ncbi:hypothetical protein N7486_002545 [Penicillium sp. IBT 16267x]|nr:hypothetical protein N7486_002545 [Penicillium sp. IBT 16267x]